MTPERIRDFVAGASFEMAATDLAGLEAAAPFLAPRTLVAITWLPRDSHDARVAAAAAIGKAGFEAMPHIGARRLRSRDELDGLLGRLGDQAGVRRALVIGGDAARPEGPFASSFDLLRSGLFERHGFRSIAFAGYPEGHSAIPAAVLQSDTAEELAAAEFAGFDPMLVSQFCFTAPPILAWLRLWLARRPVVPIRIGLAAPASLPTLIRFAARCGLGSSAKVLLGRGTSIARILTESGPEQVIHDLMTAPDVPVDQMALHLFPFGGLRRAAQWKDAVARGNFSLSGPESGFRVTVEP